MGDIPLQCRSIRRLIPDTQSVDIRNAGAMDDQLRLPQSQTHPDWRKSRLRLEVIAAGEWRSGSSIL